jgi:predicted P-loop ATPase
MTNIKEKTIIVVAEIEADTIKKNVNANNDSLAVVENDYEQTTEEQEPLDAEPIDMSALSEGISVIEIVEMILNSRYVFRYNEVTGVMEFRSIWESEFKEFTDRELNSIHRILQKKKIKFSITNLNNLIFSNFSKRYNPFIEYFNSLPEWDNTTDYIYELANTVKTTNPELWQKCFRKWIIAATACVLYPDITNQTAIVFAGGQGIGKTTWMENLCPENLKRYMFSGTINPTNKDTVINLSECWFVNLDELENMNRTEIGTLKEIITKTNIRIRRPYGKISESLPRRASFMASVNNAEFLNDPTGSRRFLCFEALDIEYLDIPRKEDHLFRSKLYR